MMLSLYRALHRKFSTSIESTATIRSVSKDLYKERNLKRVVEKFKKASEVERFRTKMDIYENTVRRLASAKRFQWIEEILEDQKKYKDISKEGFSARLITLYGKAGMFANAQKLFDEMPERECQRTVLSLNALLAAYLHSKKFDVVDSLFNELSSKLSIEPDVVSYNTVIKAFCEMGALDSAMSMLEEMEKKGVNPNLITFNTLLDGLYGKGHFSDGEKVWSLMEKKNVTPNIRSYNSKLEGLASEKKTTEAVELFEKMKKEGVKPDVFSINSLIKGFVNDGNLDEAKRWYSEIAKTDSDPNKTTFMTILPFLCEKDDLKTAFGMCKDIFNINCLVDEALLQLVVDAMVKKSMISQAEKIVQLAKSNRYCKYNLTLPSDK
ncbi:hypothetical protein L6164_032724 [Bauhinia variegata]|uniref:Uncharacterized protein n=1 Tax=Bauhinia variegata TaxID=167791 RepID=A0ACB9KPQ2_BAUVA|nr:hypothetical protein L6164_032724 [Bauhinia variegata]